MTNKSSHLRGRGKNQLEADTNTASYSQIEHQEENGGGSNAGKILQGFTELDFRNGREELESQMQVTTYLFCQSWKNINPRYKIAILRNELTRRSGSIEATMVRELRSLIATVSPSSPEEWTEELWNQIWERILQIAEQARPSPVADLPCFKEFLRMTEKGSYLDWCAMMIGQTMAPAIRPIADIALEFAIRKAIYPANFSEIWRMGGENRDEANRCLWEECARLDQQRERNRSEMANRKERKERRHVSTNHQGHGSSFSCHRCGLAGHRARDCRRDISSDRRKDFKGKEQNSRRNWNNPAPDQSKDGVKVVSTTGPHSGNPEGASSYTTAQIQGVHLPALCDTGAEINLMSWEDFNLLRGKGVVLTPRPTQKVISTAGPQDLICENYVLADIVVGNSNQIPAKVYIGKDFHGTMILGNPTLEELRIFLVQLPQSQDRAGVFYTATRMKPSENVVRNIEEILENENPEQIEGISRESLMTKEDYKSLEAAIARIQPTQQVEVAEINTPPGKFASEYRFMPNHNLEKAKKLVLDFIKEGFMEETQASKWLIPIRLARKPNGTWRFCLDYRRLNELVEQDNYPLPDVQSIFDGLYGKRIFSVLDIANGFFRVPLREIDRQKTTCKIGNRFFRMKVLPMGYKNSPAIFQRIMDKMLKEELETGNVKVYIDDILIATESYEEHVEILRRVLGILKAHGMEVNWEKVRLAYKEIRFLGHTMWMNKIKPMDDRITEVMKIPVPQTPKQVRSFLGKVNYMGRHIYNLSELKAPLNEFTSKGRKFVWNDKHQEAFENLKVAVSKIIAATMPDPRKKFTLETDASSTGVGAVLRQEDSTIGFFSMRLTPTQQRYTITERELYAIVWAMGRCKQYLLGVEFDVVTDHKAIEAFFTKKDQEFGNERIARWMQALESFQFTPKYRRGEDMVIPDGLSRMYEGTSRDLGNPSEVNGKKVLDPSDGNASRVAATLDVLPRHCNEGSEEMRRDALGRQGWQDAGGAWEEDILSWHEEFGHRKMIRDDLKEKGVLVSARELVRILRKCRVCLERDNQFMKHNEYIDTQDPGELVGIDLMEYQRRYIFVAVDYYSRMAFTFELKNKEAKNIVACLESVYGTFPFQKLLCDNGKEFANAQVKLWLRKHGVEVGYRPPYFHEGTGRVERLIRTLRDSLNRTKGTVRQKLKRVTRAYNQKVHRAIGTSPELASKPENRGMVTQAIERYKREFGKTTEPRLAEGTQVLIRKDIRQKDDKHFERVGQIVGQAGPHSYEVMPEKGKILVRNRNQLKVLKIREEEFITRNEIGIPLQEWQDHHEERY
ncbi:hypothetical protein NEIG_02291 [Nematocida sp. ERTm5]|nr:hypothetical protein NEIG_01785 [Nematocida sp. ERTm5]OAG33108.1 hypothetical protein NEIG_02291 [Nematocida sp. ERTm5]